MKILKDLIYMAVAVLAGYFIYKIWQSVSGAASSVTNAAGSLASTADSWTPSGLGSSIASDASAAWDAVTGLVSSPAVTAPAPGTDGGQVFTDPASAAEDWQAAMLDGLPSADDTLNEGF